MFPPANDPDTVATSATASTLTLRRVQRFAPAPELPFPRASVVIFDLETTGLDPQQDRIIEIGAIKLTALTPVDEFSSLVATDVELSDEIVRLTGISSAMLEGQPTVDEVLPRFLQFIQGSILVAHNAEFDLSMLKVAASRLSIDLEWPCLCTLKMARDLLPQLENKKLDTLAAHYGLSFEARHRSIGDVKVTLGVLNGLMNQEASHLTTWAALTPFAVTAT